MLNFPLSFKTNPPLNTCTLNAKRGLRCPPSAERFTIARDFWSHKTGILFRTA